MADRRATSTELAAMRLALGVLRLHTHPAEALDAVEEAAEVLRHPRWDRSCLWLAIRGSLAALAWGDKSAERLLRARLALYLRARLRVERGDCYARDPYLACTVCGRDHGWPESSQMVCVPYPRTTGGPHCYGNLTVRYRLRARITPLWQLAPAHEAHR